MKYEDQPINATSPNSSDPEWAAARTGGLTKREYFAGIALSAIGRDFGSGFNDKSGYQEAARQALFMADALIMELQK